MSFHLVNDLNELQNGKFSLKEPDINLPKWEYNDDFKSDAICIIPALAFDEAGYRLGYGKGYYDRFLSGKNITRIGVVYSEFIIDKLPLGRYDLPVDFIVTEKGIISNSKK